MKDTLLTEKDIKTLESYSEGYFYKMLHYIRDLDVYKRQVSVRLKVL